MQIIVLNSQSLFDIAIQHTGNVMNAFAIALENNISIGESLTPGRIISIPNVIVNSDILNYYKNKCLSKQLTVCTFCTNQIQSKVQIVNKVREGRPHIVDAIKNGEIAMVVNTVGSMPESVADSHSIRSSALQQRIPVYTTVAGADAISQGLNSINDTKVYRLQEMN